MQHYYIHIYMVCIYIYNCHINGRAARTHSVTLAFIHMLSPVHVYIQMYMCICIHMYIYVCVCAYIHETITNRYMSCR